MPDVGRLRCSDANPALVRFFRGRRAWRALDEMVIVSRRDLHDTVARLRHADLPHGCDAAAFPRRPPARLRRRIGSPESPDEHALPPDAIPQNTTRRPIAVRTAEAVEESIA
jgi:hypothetical protein